MDDANEVGVADDDRAGRPAAAPATIPDYSTLPPARVPTPMGVIAVVAVKVAGLYCLVQGLPLVYLLPANLLLMFAGREVGLVDVLVNLLHPAVYIVAGLLLVNRATWVATRVLGFEEPSDDPRARAPGRRLQAIAFSVLGVWLVLGGMIEAVRLLALARHLASLSGDDVIQSATDDPSGLAATAAQLALGLWLFFGSERLASFWHRFRMRPTPPVGDER